MTQKGKIGDGKLPNLYWVTVHGDWLTNRGTFKQKEGNCFDWAGDTYKDLEMPKPLYFGPFKTFDEALGKLDEERWRLVDPKARDDYQGEYRTIEIEDRLSGVLYEIGYTEVWNMRKYRGTNLVEVLTTFDTRDDTKYTREKLGSDFV